MLQLEHLGCCCWSPPAPPSWFYKREVNPDSYWITGFSIHMQAAPVIQLCYSGGPSVLWEVLTGCHWWNEDSSAQLVCLDCFDLPEGSLSHWIHCVKFIIPEGSTWLFVQLILEACLVDLLYGCILTHPSTSEQVGLCIPRASRSTEQWHGVKEKIVDSVVLCGSKLKMISELFYSHLLQPASSKVRKLISWEREDIVYLIFRANWRYILYLSLPSV